MKNENKMFGWSDLCHAFSRACQIERKQNFVSKIDSRHGWRQPESERGSNIKGRNERRPGETADDRMARARIPLEK